MVSSKNITLNIKNAKYSVITRDPSTGAVAYGAFRDIPNLNTINIEPEDQEGTDIFGDGEVALTIRGGLGKGKITSTVSNSLGGLFRKEVLGWTQTAAMQYANGITSCKPSVMFYFEEDLSQSGNCSGNTENIRKHLFGEVEFDELVEEREAKSKDPAENTQELVGNYKPAKDTDWAKRSRIFMDGADKTQTGFDYATFIAMSTTPSAPKFPKAVASGMNSGSATINLTNLPIGTTKIELKDNTLGTIKDEAVSIIVSGSSTVTLSSLNAGTVYDVILNGEVLTTFTAS